MHRSCCGLVRRHDLSAGALASAAALAVATLVTALLGIALTREAGHIAVFWPVNGLIVGALLRLPAGRHLVTLSVCLLANLAAYLLAVDAFALAAGLAGCNLLEVLLAAQLAQRLIGRNFILADLGQLFVLCGAGVVASAVGATIAALLLSAAHGS